MDFIQTTPETLDWRLDFSPRRPWPAILPTVATFDRVVVAGFERRCQSRLDVILVPGPASEALKNLWPEDDLAPLETLRFRRAAGEKSHDENILEWPLSLQNVLDDKLIPVKNLKPLAHLTAWRGEITDVLVQKNFSASQVREILDLLCDLKMGGKTWRDCQPENPDAAAWIGKLRSLRFPETTRADHGAQDAVQALPWPRGVQARWERQGDQAGLVLQARVAGPNEWRRLRENLHKLDLEDKLWT